ncbi:LacI family transcriptional regulator [Rhodoligotrophos appendicifer]|uniref:LacI family DNA-binding transcriptional regulator n=1 Tax=Rhodoligotrophos appendicifer TaxID=987056 RepID=UPI0014788D0C|nr:LacI family DNA-binding transcriptional regulator [Rhodoligotrophos appendicifer]
MNPGPPLRDRKRAQRRTSDRVRVEDVAMAAGVSGATVSRALNRPTTVSPAIRRKVEDAVASLGYVPNGAARALASQKTRVIGAIVPTLENMNFAISVEAAQTRLVGAGYNFLVASTGYNPAREMDHIQAFLAHGVDGIILVGAQRDAEVVEFLRQRRVPYVVTWTMTADGTPCVGFDNAEAARRLTSHLLDLGHRQIGVVAGLTRNNDRAAGRLEGIHRALEQRGLALPRELLIERPYKIAEGQLALRALMAGTPRPTAIICGNDQLAFGALIECGRQGIDVPGDVSIAGFDDLEFAGQIVPALTTVHVPAEEIGLRAADYLLAHIDGEPAAAVTEVTVSLIIRASSAPPRAVDAVLPGPATPYAKASAAAS